MQSVVILIIANVDLYKMQNWPPFYNQNSVKSPFIILKYTTLSRLYMPDIEL
jgi:hypothetical protein